MASKKEIYAQHGIELKDGKINSPIGYINPLLVDGNSKIGKGVFHFSTLPANVDFTVNVNGKAMTVKGTCPCRCAGCYAMSGNFRYQSVKDGLAVRTLIARDYMDYCEKAINAQIKADKVKIIRIHASGDFFSYEYALMWKRIAENNPDVLMWTYTKNKACQDVFNGLANANIVKSVIPGKGFNFGHCDYILSCYEYLKAQGKTVYICRCGIDKGQHCVNCHGCAKNEYVLFIEHSTAYKAEKDPLFPVLKAVIDSQPAQD